MELSEYIDMHVVHLVDLGREYYYIHRDKQNRWVMVSYRKTPEGKPLEGVHYNVNEKDPF